MKVLDGGLFISIVYMVLLYGAKFEFLDVDTDILSLFNVTILFFTLFNSRLNSTTDHSKRAQIHFILESYHSDLFTI